MKNESFKYPFPRLEDGLFDTDNDGKLDTLETFCRDMHIDEMNRKKDSGYNEQDNLPKYKISLDSENILANVLGGALAIIALIPALILGVCFLLMSFTNDKR